MSDEKLGLADVLHQLGTELREAAQRGGDTLTWVNGELELELSIEKSGEGGIQFYVLSGGAAVASNRTTRFRLLLTPHADFDQEHGMGM
ncbi:hypothetical protein D9V41_09155 [Aeromicrobium phragmitis]|uniref:Trypsin-co-occurring domain-containing protein n=1 Tax=Aeromicrobium phragmitis TaxID=2478914 RepID=A0A3L8PKY1_9ACTN|nr:trypco2 family protein [Aeromicrobium phragmitis]RLV56045.1 hypothetical protein D9V41_09155 [Aeromicrobium phragmitis]